MDETSLHKGIRPECPNSLHDLGIAIDCEATRVKSHRIKEPPYLRLRAFRNPILTSYDCMTEGIHQDYQAKGAVQKRTIKDKALAASYFGSRQRRRIQIVANHAVKLPWAMSALGRELTDRISFHDPAPKPFQFICFPSLDIAPTERAEARLAIPALFAIGIMAIPFYEMTYATRAVFFYPL